MSSPRHSFCDTLFGKAAATVASNIPGTESCAVKQFLNSSNELSEMRKLKIQHPNHAGFTEMLNKLDGASSFSEILSTLERLDFKHSNEPAVQKLGSFGMKALLYSASFVHHEGAFAYQAAYLREKAESEMTRLGYSTTTPSINN